MNKINYKIVCFTLSLFFFLSCLNQGKKPIYLFKKFGRASTESYKRWEGIKVNKIDTIIFLNTKYESGIKDYSVILYQINGVGYLEGYYDADKKFKKIKGKRTNLRNKHNEDFRVYRLQKMKYNLDSVVNFIVLNLDTLKKPKVLMPDIVGIGGGTYYDIKIGNDSFGCSYHKNFIERYPNSHQINLVNYILYDIKRQVIWY
jgi:hypothetical protein